MSFNSFPRLTTKPQCSHDLQEIIQSASHSGSDRKASACSAGDPGSIPGSGRSPGEGNGNPLQYSWLENPVNGGAWWAIVHGVTKSRTRLSDFTFTFLFLSHPHVHTHTVIVCNLPSRAPVSLLPCVSYNTPGILVPKSIALAFLSVRNAHPWNSAFCRTHFFLGLYLNILFTERLTLVTLPKM